MIIISAVKKGQYVVCKDDQGKHWYTKTGETEWDINTYHSKKLSSVTNGNIYRVFGKKIVRDITKKSRFGGSFKTTSTSFKIKSDKGYFIWIPIHRFEFNPEADKNQSRFDKLEKILK